MVLLAYAVLIHSNEYRVCDIVTNKHLCMVILRVLIERNQEINSPQAAKPVNIPNEY